MLIILNISNSFNSKIIFNNLAASESGLLIEGENPALQTSGKIVTRCPCGGVSFCTAGGNFWEGARTRVD